MSMPNAFELRIVAQEPGDKTGGNIRREPGPSCPRPSLLTPSSLAIAPSR